MAIAENVFPIIAIALIGYLLARRGFFDARDIAGISRYVFAVALPVLLFDSLANVELPARIEWGFLLAYYLSAFVVYGLAMLAGRLNFGLDLREQGVFGLGAAYSNTVLLGIPIVYAAFGEEGMLPIFLLISVHSAIMFFLVTVFAEIGGGNGGSYLAIAVDSVKKILTNPIIFGLIVGLLFNFLAIGLPKPLDQVVELISRSALPIALFVLGATLSTYRLSGHFSEAWTMVGLKIVLHPVLVWLLAWFVFRVAPLWGAVAVVTAAMPVGINSYLFAQRYRVCIATTATAIVLSTTLAIGSLTLWLTLLG